MAALRGVRSEPVLWIAGCRSEERLRGIKTADSSGLGVPGREASHASSPLVICVSRDLRDPSGGAVEGGSPIRQAALPCDVSQVLKPLQTAHFRRQQPVVLRLPAEAGRRPMPAFRQISAAGTPSRPCSRTNAVRASENLYALVALRSSQPGTLARKTPAKTIRF